MNEDRPRFIERVQKSVAPEDARQNRSNGMITLGAVLLVFIAVALAVNGGDVGTSPGVFLFGLLGTGLIVGGLVIRR